MKKDKLEKMLGKVKIDLKFPEVKEKDKITVGDRIDHLAAVSQFLHGWKFDKAVSRLPEPGVDVILANLDIHQVSQAARKAFLRIKVEPPKKVGEEELLFQEFFHSALLEFNR